MIRPLRPRGPGARRGRRSPAVVRGAGRTAGHARARLRVAVPGRLRPGVPHDDRRRSRRGGALRLGARPSLLLSRGRHVRDAGGLELSPARRRPRVAAGRRRGRARVPRRLGHAAPERGGVGRRRLRCGRGQGQPRLAPARRRDRCARGSGRTRGASGTFPPSTRSRGRASRASSSTCLRGPPSSGRSFSAGSPTPGRASGCRRRKASRPAREPAREGEPAGWGRASARRASGW